MGKTRSLLSWAGVELFFVSNVVSSVMFGTYSSSIADQNGISSTTLGWLSGVFFVVFALTQLYSGRLLVILPAKPFLSTSALIATFGALLFAHASTIPLLFLARVALGIGLATTFVGVLFIVQRDFPQQRFSVMSAISQSIANLLGGFSGLLLGFVADYHISFDLLASALFVTSIIIIVTPSAPESRPMRATVSNSIFESARQVLANPQVWYASLYFSGLFGAVLTFADLYNITFQMQVFREPFGTATIINAMVLFGMSIGGLCTGYWAQRPKGYLLPARVLSGLAVLAFAVILFVRLDPRYAVTAISATCFLFGFGCSGSVLAFQCVQHNVPEAVVRPLANSFILTFAYLFSGLIEQPLVGKFIADTVIDLSSAVDETSLQKILFDFSLHDAWHKYNAGFYFVLAFVFTGFVVSFFFRQRTES